MEASEKRIMPSYFYFGLLTTAGLIAFFFLMRMLDLIQIVELRFLNVFIMIAGVATAINHKVMRRDNKMVNYLEGLSQGISTGLVTSISFSLFIMFYLMIDRTFMNYLIEHALFGQYLNPYTASWSIALESIASTFICSFVIMQYYKHYAAH